MKIIEKPSFKRKTMTIQDFLIDLYPSVDCNPIGQRPPIYGENAVQNEKSEAIILSILNNIDIGTITLVDVKEEDGKWKWESLDGGHRKRSIPLFVNGKFSAGGRYYSELNEEEQARFKNYDLSFTLYDPLSNEMKGKIFRSLNETTHVNEIEMLNSYGNTAIANVIRETVRPISKPYIDEETLETGYQTTIIHDLFDVTKEGNLKWIEGNNFRLKQDEFVARVYYTFYKGGKLCNRSTVKVQEMYDNPKTNAYKLKKKVDKFLDFLYEMSKVKRQTAGRGITNSEKNTLLNIYIYLSDSFKSDVKVNDPFGFYTAFAKVYLDLYNDPYEKWTEVPDLDFESKDSTVNQLFKDYTRNHDHAEKQTQLVKWMTEHPEWEDIYDYMILKDRNRSFPDWMKQTALLNQNGLCEIDGLPLVWEDADAGHIEAHALGGKTILTNCAMIRKVHNKAMGTMDVREYKKVYDEAVA